MDVKLVVVGGKKPGTEVPVAGPKFFIGRAEDCHLRPQSDLVSRHHAVILVEDGFVAIRDFGSRNGTFVNDQRIKTEQELKSGDRLRIGPLEFEVRLDVKVGGKKKPKVHSIREAAARTAQAAPSATAEDAEIANWLGNERTTADETASDTQRVAAASPGPGSDTPPPAAPGAESSAEKKKKEVQPGQIPGRFGTGQKPAAESSRAAAEQTLRQLFQHKR